MTTWRAMESLTTTNVLVRLRLPGFDVEGWLATHLRCNPRTFWSWDPRVAKVTNFVPGVEPRFLPGLVEPVAWAEMPPLFVLTPDGAPVAVPGGAA